MFTALALLGTEILIRRNVTARESPTAGPFAERSGKAKLRARVASVREGRATRLRRQQQPSQLRPPEIDERSINFVRGHGSSRGTVRRPRPRSRARATPEEYESAKRTALSAV